MRTTKKRTVMKTHKELNLQYIGGIFSGKGFRNKETGQESYYTRRGDGFSDPCFTWRGVPMYFVTGSRYGIAAHHTKEQRGLIFYRLKEALANHEPAIVRRITQTKLKT